MSAQIQKGETFTDVSPGKSVTSTRLNNHVDGAILLPGCVTEQTDVSTALASDDTLLIHDTSASGLKKVQAQNLLVPEAITAKTDISTAIAAGDFLLMADVSASNALLKVQAQNILPVEAITAKTDLSATVAQDDLVLISDTSASAALKKATVASLHPSGALIQCVATSDAAATAIAATIPLDDSIPQSGEGTQLLTQAITPGNTSNILEIEVFVPFTGTTSGAAAIVALFQDATANALAATLANTGASGYSSGFHLIHRMAAGTTSATTFKVRVGATSGTLTINGQSSARLLGGVSAARLIIRELKA